jgi:hypothetical protein
LELEDSKKNVGKFMDSNDFFKTGDSLDDIDPTLHRCLKGYDAKRTGFAIRNVRLPKGGPFGYFDFEGQAGGILVAPLITQDDDDRRILAEVDDWLLAGKGALPPELSAKLATVEDFRIDEGVHIRTRRAVHRLAAQARTRSVFRGDPPHNEIERRLQRFLDGQRVLEQITARFDPKMSRIEEIRGLRILTNGRSPRDDAIARIGDQLLSSLFGENIKLVVNAADSKPDQSRQRFDQRIVIDGREYELFGRGEGGNLDFPGVFLFYDVQGGFLKQIQNGTVAVDVLEPALRAGSLISAGEAQVAAFDRQPEARIAAGAQVTTTLGVFVRRELEHGARFAYKLAYEKPGETPFELYVDAISGDPIPGP